jgi:hypothetical protein
LHPGFRLILCGTALKMRVAIRDNGSGIDPEVVRFGRESHWGLHGMRERARNLGGQLRIWSRGRVRARKGRFPSPIHRGKPRTPQPSVVSLRLPFVNRLTLYPLHRKWYFRASAEW